MAVITIGLIILVTALMENEQDITAVQRKWILDSTDVGILSGYWFILPWNFIDLRERNSGKKKHGIPKKKCRKKNNNKY